MIVPNFEKRITFWKLRGIYADSKILGSNPGHLGFCTFFLTTPTRRLKVDYRKVGEEYSIVSAERTMFDVDGVLLRWATISAPEALMNMDMI